MQDFQLPAHIKLTTHVHALTRVFISHLRDLHLILQGLKPRKTIFYSRFEFKRCFTQLISREEVRIWRCELLFEKWLADELDIILNCDCDGLLRMTSGSVENQLSVLERYAQPQSRGNSAWDHRDEFMSQSMQYNENVQNTQAAPYAHHKQYVQNAPNTMHTQNIQNVQSVQNAYGAQNLLNTQYAQHTPSPQHLQTTRNTLGLENVQNVQTSAQIMDARPSSNAVYNQYIQNVLHGQKSQYNSTLHYHSQLQEQNGLNGQKTQISQTDQNLYSHNFHSLQNEQISIQPGDVIGTQSDVLINNACDSLRNLIHLMNTQDDHKIFLSIVNIIYQVLHSENQVLEAMHTLFQLLHTMRRLYFQEIQDMLQHIQRIILRKNDDRDVYKCVFSYTLDDQGPNNEVLYALKEDLNNIYVDPLEALIEESQATLNNMLLQVKVKIQEEYRTRLQMVSVTINREDTNQNNLDIHNSPDIDDASNRANQSIFLEFSEEFVKSRYNYQILELLRQHQDEYDDNYHFNKAMQDDTQLELSKISSHKAQKSAMDVQKWIDRQFFWKEKMRQLHHQRKMEICEHQAYMSQYLQQVSLQRLAFERIRRSGDTVEINRWKSAITIQCFIRSQKAIQFRKRKLKAIATLQSAFRLYYARKQLRKLRDSQFSDHDSRAQVALWQRRKEIYALTEKFDSQIIFGHLMLRKEMEEVEQKMIEEQSQFYEQWDIFVKKAQRDMQKRPLKSEWTEQTDAITGKKKYINYITGHEQFEHPNLKNMKNYIITEGKHHRESFENRQNRLQEYIDQIGHHELVQRTEFMRVYETAMKECSKLVI